MKTAYHHCTLFTGDTQLKEAALLTQDGIVEQVISDKQIPSGYELRDLGGLMAAPALIDLQIYGGAGKLFSLYPSVEALEGIRRFCQAGGASHFQATVATNSLQIMHAAIDAAKSYRAQGLPGLIGLHLEGPYINPLKRGAHLERYIHVPTVEEVDQLLERAEGVVTMMTLAPERCPPSVISKLQDHGVVVSAGHSMASFRQAMDAFDKGVLAATHLFNAMSPLQGREPGLVGAILDHPGVRCSVVADGIHVDFNSIRICKKIMGERLWLITDAVEENPKGDYVYIRTSDRYVTGEGILAGSLLTMMSAVKNCVTEIGISLEESLRMASTYPARVIHREKEFGKLLPGCRADIVVFDGEYQVRELITGKDQKTPFRG
ncbi:MAG TPA: N-acetylglucosamine-6-phosphate deacetylase [Chitinophagaceae bacterium]|nr:N-acetylglucosamine-6-phosphate deacetylase [Chitinophagaceae bacterium]